MIAGRPRAAAGALCLLALAGAGCQSSQEKSAELAKESLGAINERGLTIKTTNRDVTVGDTTVISDQYGSAAVVELRSKARADQVGVPVLISVESGQGETVFRNDAAGLAPALTHIPVLAAGESTFWVNDQVTADQGRRVTAKVGTPEGKPPARIPRLQVTSLKLESDTDGALTRGRVHNRSKIDQRLLTLFAIARRGDKVVAAGRSGVERLKAGRAATFKVYWIGDPKGAKVSVAAPASTFE